MKVKKLLELITLSSSIYYLAKEYGLVEKLKEMSENGLDQINSFTSEEMKDEDGNDLELMDKILMKTENLKKDFEIKVEELVHKFYEKMHITHTDEIKALNERLEKSDRLIALLEAKVNHLEAKE